MLIVAKFLGTFAATITDPIVWVLVGISAFCGYRRIGWWAPLVIAIIGELIIVSMISNTRPLLGLPPLAGDRIALMFSALAAWTYIVYAAVFFFTKRPLPAS